MADVLLAVILLPIVFALVVIWSMSRPYEGHDKHTYYCADNLHGFAKAFAIYAQRYRGRFPPDLDTLVSTRFAQPVMFVCPNNQPANDAFDAIEAYSPGQPITPELRDILHSCYVYIPGQTAPGDAGNVLMYDKKGCHPDDGGSILFADGHVQWVEPYWKIEQLVAQTKERLATDTQPAVQPEGLGD